MKPLGWLHPANWPLWAKYIEQTKPSYVSDHIVDLGALYGKGIKELLVEGDWLYIYKITSPALIRLNHPSNPPIEASYLRKVATPFKALYVDVSASFFSDPGTASGYEMRFLVGHGGAFAGEPVGTRVSVGYTLASYDLNTARTNTDESTNAGIGSGNGGPEVKVGLGFSVVDLTPGATVSVRLSTTTDALIALAKGMSLSQHEFSRLYMTNTSQPGSTLKLWVER